MSLLEKFSPDPSKAGNTLLLLNVAGMVLAALSNTFAAANDKNTSAEDKKFLIPAGLVTGVANIAAYFGVTKTFCKSFTKKAEGVLSKMSDEDVSKKALNLVNKMIGKEKNAQIAESMKSNFLKTVLDENGKEITKASEKAINLYKTNFKAGADVLGAFAGAVVGCAILTPIIRDVSAYIMQKRMEKNNPEMAEKPYRPYFDPSHVKGGYSRKQPLSMTSFMAFTSTNGRMKV